MAKITIDKLAQMTQDEFGRMSETLTELKEGQQRLDKQMTQMNTTLKTVLDVVLEIPSKKAFERLETKVERMDVELVAIQRKVK